MQIHLIRHGQSMWQVNQSQSQDSDITPLGKVQAYYLNNQIREIMDNDKKKTVVYVSPLKRAIQTVDTLGKEYILEPKIQEANFHVAEFLPKFAQPLNSKRIKSDNIPYMKFRNDIKVMLDNILLKNEYNNIYFYTHGGVIKTLLRIIHDNDSICYKIHNCSITKIVWYRSRWQVYSLNDVSFMPREYIT
jgi:broad specificity phosphatase PhoE